MKFQVKYNDNQLRIARRPFWKNLTEIVDADNKREAIEKSIAWQHYGRFVDFRAKKI